MTADVLPCPFCGDKMQERQGYAHHTDHGKDSCLLGKITFLDLERWNLRAWGGAFNPPPGQIDASLWFWRFQAEKAVETAIRIRDERDALRVSFHALQRHVANRARP